LLGEKRIAGEPPTLVGHRIPVWYKSHRWTIFRRCKHHFWSDYRDEGTVLARWGTKDLISPPSLHGPQDGEVTLFVWWLLETKPSNKAR